MKQSVKKLKDLKPTQKWYKIDEGCYDHAELAARFDQKQVKQPALRLVKEAEQGWMQLNSSIR